MTLHGFLGVKFSKTRNNSKDSNSGASCNNQDNTLGSLMPCMQCHSTELMPLSFGTAVRASGEGSVVSADCT